MGDSKAISSLGSTGRLIKNTLEVILRNLDVRELVVVICVQVKIRYNVAKVLHDSLAGCVAGRVRWPHIGRVFSNNVADCHLVPDHLVVSLSIGNDAEVLMRPCVACYLVAFGHHTLDHAGPAFGRVDSPLSIVDTSDEEGSLEAIFGKLIEDLVGVDVRATGTKSVKAT